eukprot:gene29145-51088_t
MVLPQEDIRNSFPPDLAADCEDPAEFARLAGLADQWPYMQQIEPLPQRVMSPARSSDALRRSSAGAKQRWAMTIPDEFTAEGVKAASEGDLMPYVPFLKSGEPYRSPIRNNPWTRPPAAGDALEWGQGHYYDTTVGRKHPHWRDAALPQATRDMHQMRRDLVDWGYCLIEDGVSPAQCARLHERVADQAAAERALGVAHLNVAQQHVWALVNKGADFVGCMEFDPAFVQAGPLVERLLDETLGK